MPSSRSRRRPLTSVARFRSSVSSPSAANRVSKIPDLLVAAAAEEHDLTLLHYDADFDLIASVTGQRCRWIVPAGAPTAALDLGPPCARARDFVVYMLRG